ncbi:hypothetical protein CFIMG_004588RA [Ceratocystis fimbriata CBS 114723]|uniref:Uncharacterized protein n=1 Tax=Ceratocystis fimbriata CBS 114723 TaxID=1035309 RepID=A0A2C5WW54_9PEZI|nr:hypothetical protein CFIMG_004588RA [Ceratocystis fimbriata CBS 114723]
MYACTISNRRAARLLRTSVLARSSQVTLVSCISRRQLYPPLVSANHLSIAEMRLPAAYRAVRSR